VIKKSLRLIGPTRLDDAYDLNKDI